MVLVLVVAAALATCVVYQWTGAETTARSRSLEAVRGRHVVLELAQGAELEACIARRIRGGAIGAMVGLTLGTALAIYWLGLEAIGWPEVSGLIIAIMTMLGCSHSAGAVGESWVAARSVRAIRGTRRVAHLERRDPMRYVHPRERLTVAAMLAVIFTVAVPALAEGGRIAQATMLMIAVIAVAASTAWWAARRVLAAPAVAEDQARAATSDLLTRDTLDRLLDHVTGTVWLATLYTGLMGNGWMSPTLAFGVTLFAGAGTLALWSAREARRAPVVASP